MSEGILLLGDNVVAELDASTEARAAEFAARADRLATVSIIAGDKDHLPSTDYMALKKKVGRKLGINVVDMYPGTPRAIRDQIIRDNADPRVDGIVLQLPVADTDEEQSFRIRSLIAHDKDVDGLNPFSNKPTATSVAGKSLVDSYSIDYMNERVRVFGLGPLFGAPLLELLHKAGAADIAGYDLKNSNEDERLAALNEADIIFSAMGVPGAITPDLFADPRPRVLIDAGTTGVGGATVGDMSDDMRNFALERGWKVTPPKRGVGLVTVHAILAKVMDAAEARLDKKPRFSPMSDEAKKLATRALVNQPTDFRMRDRDYDPHFLPLEHLGDVV